MKRKIFKIASYAIPLITGGAIAISGLTSCQNGGTPVDPSYEGNPLPSTIDGNNVFDITGTTLNGFSTWFTNNKDKYSSYNEIIIPTNIKSISESAFRDTNTPDYIKILSVEAGSADLSFGRYAFNYTNIEIVDLHNAENVEVKYQCFNSSVLKEISLPKKIKAVERYGFMAKELKKIIWNSTDNVTENISKFDANTFSLKDSSKGGESVQGDGQFIIGRNWSLDLISQLKLSFIDRFNDWPNDINAFRSWTVCFNE